MLSEDLEILFTCFDVVIVVGKFSFGVWLGGNANIINEGPSIPSTDINHKNAVHHGLECGRGIAQSEHHD